MAPKQAPLLQSTSLLSAHAPHFHLPEDDVCPLCDQPIPHDRFDEIKERIEARQREQQDDIAARIAEQVAAERAQALEQARQEAAAVIDRARQENAGLVEAARLEERQAAEVMTSEQVAAAKRAGEEAQALLQTKLDQAAATATSLEETRAALQTQLDQAHREGEAAVLQAKQEAAAKEEEIRADAMQRAESAMEEKLAAAEASRQELETSLKSRIQEVEAGKHAAEQAGVDLKSQMEQVRRDGEAAIEKLKVESAAEAEMIRNSAAAAAQAAAQQKIQELEQAKVEADSKSAAAEERLQALQQAQEIQLTQRLQEQREAFELDKASAVAAEKSAAFEEKMKLSTKVEELQRVIDKNTAEELGEGAELDLLEALKTEFEGDRISRINKGQPGADILHIVMLNGKECGTIIYDSKNHNAWRNDFVTKLAADQMAAKAEHAILSTRKFPAGVRHLHVQDGVILAGPSRVVAVAQIIRQHLLQTHTLRLSNEARTQKTAALYQFITSERCSDLLARFDTHAEALLELQEKEIRAHNATWKKQGELVRSVQKVRAELCNEIDTIIGTAEDPE